MIQTELHSSRMGPQKPASAELVCAPAATARAHGPQPPRRPDRLRPGPALNGWQDNPVKPRRSSAVYHNACSEVRPRRSRYGNTGNSSVQPRIPVIRCATLLDWGTSRAIVLSVLITRRLRFVTSFRAYLEFSLP